MSDEKIINAIKNGDETAIEQVMDKYSRLLWTVASAVLKNVASEQDVEECVADVFISLWQNPEKYDAARGGLRTWLCIKTRSRALDRYREISRRSALPLEEVIAAETIGAAELAAEEETRRELAAAIDTLAVQEREILIRRYYYGQKPREIALALDMSVKKVDNCLYRAKRKLREELEEHNERV